MSFQIHMQVSMYGTTYTKQSPTNTGVFEVKSYVDIKHLKNLKKKFDQDPMNTCNYAKRPLTLGHVADFLIWDLHGISEYTVTVLYKLIKWKKVRIIQRDVCRTHSLI